MTLRDYFRADGRRMPVYRFRLPKTAGSLKQVKTPLVTLLLALLAVTLMAVTPAAAEESNRRWQAGGRLGFNDGRNDEDFLQAEIFLAHLLPLPIAQNAPLSFQIVFEGSAGVIGADSEEGLVAAAGPGLALGFWQDRLMVKAGVSPTFISRDRFGKEDLGGPVQFTSHVGLSAGVYRGLRVGYRFQHMSNAGLYDRNPGLNLHMLEVAWRF
jgi:hypothetical protein